MNITIVGNGAWGGAMGSLLATNKIPFNFWVRNQHMPQNTDLFLIAVPVQALREIAICIQDNAKKSIIVNCAKGIEKDSHKLPFQIIQEILGKDVEYVALMGPSFAGEIIEKMPTLVNGATLQKELSSRVQKLFETEYFRIWPTSSIEAVELAAAFKNVYAIAAGISAGLGYGINTQTKLILTAINEFSLLSQTLGYTIEAVASPGIIGDLVLTCNSIESRNFRFGTLLAQYSVTRARSDINALVEGYSTAFSVDYFRNKARIKLPLASFVWEVVQGVEQAEVREKFLLLS